MRILLIENEPNLGAAVQEHARQAGPAVDWLQRLAETDAAIRNLANDALLLDLHLPDGLDFLRALRARRDVLPVVILTALDRVSDQVEWLSAGADDFVVKPFDLNKLNATACGNAAAISSSFGSRAINAASVRYRPRVMIAATSSPCTATARSVLITPAMRESRAARVEIVF